MRGGQYRCAPRRLPGTSSDPAVALRPRSLAAMFRRRARQPAIDLTVLDPKWRRPVEEAMASRAKFDGLVGRLPKGPTRDRLETLRPRLDEGVVACWETATNAQAAAAALEVLEPDRVTARMKDLRRRLSELPEGAIEADRLQTELDALSTQLASVSRLWDSLDDVSERLRLLEVRLDSAVAQAAELVLAPPSGDAFSRVEADLTSAVEELEAVRPAVAALQR
jgi:hypothetical protein